MQRTESFDGWAILGGYEKRHNPRDRDEARLLVELRAQVVHGFFERPDRRVDLALLFVGNALSKIGVGLVGMGRGNKKT